MFTLSPGFLLRSSYGVQQLRCCTVLQHRPLSAGSQALIKNKFTFAMKKDAEELLAEQEGQLKPRRHPGVRRRAIKVDELPIKLQLAATNILNKYRGKKFRADVERVRREFLDILVSQEGENFNKNFKSRRVGFDHLNQQSSDGASTSNSQLFSNSRQAKLKVKEEEEKDEQRRKFFIREPYNEIECAAYMAARLPANYSALSTVLQEITQEEPDFRPKTLFDFGSGLGTSIWAADELWKGELKEVFAVDLNEQMNELSRELLQNGSSHDEGVLDKVFYRQFLPAKHYPTYDLVICAFSLLELTDTRSRIYVVENLWKKTSGMLVFVEHGSKAGFAAVMEARNFVLQVSNRQLDPLEAEKRRKEDNSSVSRRLATTEGSVVAPCPHDYICPRVSEMLAKSYCNFTSSYKEIDVGQAKPNIKSEKFTYVVLKRHSPENEWTEGQKSWPRVVQPVVKKSRHSICRVCTSDGQLAEVILSKAKNEQSLYRTGRSLKWGDKLPVDIVEKPPKVLRTPKDDNVSNQE